MRKTRLIPSKAVPYSPCGSMTITREPGYAPLLNDLRRPATVFDLPLPVEPTIAPCLVTRRSRSIDADRFSELE